MNIVRSDLIHSVDDLVGLNIVDFGRKNGGLFDGPHKAIKAAANFCVKAMTYSIIDKAVEEHSAHLQHLGQFLYHALQAKVGLVEASRLNFDIVLEFSPMSEDDEE